MDFADQLKVVGVPATRIVFFRVYDSGSSTALVLGRAIMVSQFDQQQADLDVRSIFLRVDLDGQLRHGAVVELGEGGCGGTAKKQCLMEQVHGMVEENPPRSLTCMTASNPAIEVGTFYVKVLVSLQTKHQ